MRQTKEEMEKYKDECEEYQKRLQVEVIRREEVSEKITSTSYFVRFFCLRIGSILCRVLCRGYFSSFELFHSLV